MTSVDLEGGGHAPDDGQPPEDGRGPTGRPRSPEADDAILAAAVELFAEVGFDGLSIEHVARRAGVAKSTVYRRYPGKSELVADAMDALAAGRVVDPDTGSVRDDLVAIVGQIHATLTETDVGRALPSTLVAAAHHEEFTELHRRFVRHKRQPSLGAVRRGVERGELEAGADPELVVDLLVGPLFYRLFVSRAGVDEGWVETVVDRVLGAFAGPPRPSEGRAESGE